VTRLEQKPDRSWQWWPTGYVACMAIVMLGYVRFDSYQIDGDAVSYMDLASSLLHGRWHEAVNGLWNPGYPALLAVGKLFAHADRMHELQVFYWVNYFIFLGSIACAWFFVRSMLCVRRACVERVGGALWALPDRLFYLVAYSVLFVSWTHEFSLGKIRVDGLFASLLLLAFGFLLRAVFTPRPIFDILLGISLGLAYLVKSPGFVIAVVTFFLLAIYSMGGTPAKYRRRGVLISAVMFVVIAGPYMAALSLQKGRPDFGDSAKLNYAWLVDGTAPQDLLNNQPARFGISAVLLKHSEIELLSKPVVVYFPHFHHATYGPWFDPSYFNEGIKPQVNLGRQLRLFLQQSRHFLRFVVIHAVPLAFLIFCFACGMRIVREPSARRMLLLIYAVTLFSFVMYLAVHFLDRYVGGQLWIVLLATVGLLTAKDAGRKYLVEGAAAFLAIAVLLFGLQLVMQQRQTVVLHGLGHGWHNPAEFDTATLLRQKGIVPGDTVACFRACNEGTYWARLAGVRVVAEIYDPAYMTDSETGNEIWRKLPNKQQALDALRSTGAKALVGYFENPPGSDGWQHLAGGYYLISLRGIPQVSQ